MPTVAFVWPTVVSKLNSSTIFTVTKKAKCQTTLIRFFHETHQIARLTTRRVKDDDFPSNSVEDPILQYYRVLYNHQYCWTFLWASLQFFAMSSVRVVSEYNWSKSPPSRLPLAHSSKAIWLWRVYSPTFSESRRQLTQLADVPFHRRVDHRSIWLLFTSGSLLSAAAKPNLATTESLCPAVLVRWE